MKGEFRVQVRDLDEILVRELPETITDFTEAMQKAIEVGAKDKTVFTEVRKASTGERLFVAYRSRTMKRMNSSSFLSALLEI